MKPGEGAATKDYIADRGFAGEPVYLTDLGRCLPAEALSEKRRRGHWRMLVYETDTLAGTMLLAGPETGAPEISYPLGVSGWHAVSVGMLADSEQPLRVLAKLSGEETFTVLTLPVKKHRGEAIQELFWRVADLTGRGLVLQQLYRRLSPGNSPGSLQCHNARVAYIKLVPLSAAEARAVQTERRDPANRRLFAHNDCGSYIYGQRPTGAEEMRRCVEPLRDTDFGRLYWEAGGGDHASYFSKIARVPFHDPDDDYVRVGDRMHREAWNGFRKNGIDPLRVALESAHEAGLELHAGYRVAGFHYPPPLDTPDVASTFYGQHPELRGRNRDGNETPRIAYTYPETRHYVVSILKEIAGYPVDGICLLYNRRPPLVEYEAPLVEGFIKEHGEDPRKLDQRDPRWLKYRAGVLTQFMREVREAMDEVAREQRRKRIDVSAIVMSSEAENLHRAMDVKAWVEEGLVDTIIPYSSVPNLDSSKDSWADVRDARYFVEMTRGTACKLALNIMPRQIRPGDYRRRAAALYAAGVEHLFFWDCDIGWEHDLGRVNHTDSWNALRRLGHRQEMDAWLKAGGPSLDGPLMPIRKLGDWNLAYDTPG